MTMQLPEYCLVDGTYFVLLEGTLPFRPKGHGLTVSWPHTGCWRGFQAIYRLEGASLLLQSVDVYLPDAQVPPVLAGCAALSFDSVHSAFTHRFDDVNLRLRPRGGRMLLGADPLRDVDGVGLTTGYSWRRVLLLTFDREGEATCLDVSSWAEEIRRQARERALGRDQGD